MVDYDTLELTAARGRMPREVAGAQFDCLSRTTSTFVTFNCGLRGCGNG